MFSVRLSVRHVRVLHIQMAEDIVELLSRPDSPVILVFDPEKDLRFSPEIAVYLGNGCYATLVGSHRWWMSVPMTLSDLERRDAMGHFSGSSP